MARYWIVVASADHIRTAVDGHFVQAGHGRRAPVETFHHGDGVACYAPRERISAGAKVQAFTAIGEVKGDQVLAVDRGAIGMHHRRRVAWQDHASSAPIRPILDQLGFTRDRGAAWGLAFRRGLFEISKDDFQIIAEAMGVARP